MSQPDEGHLDLDTLAELDEGLLASPEAAAHDGHLSGCLPCREQLARIRATRALLAALPAESMPPDVASRLDDALAGAAATGSVLPVHSARRRWHTRPTAAGLAAAAAVVALVGALVVGKTVGSSPDDEGPGTLAESAGGAAPKSTDAYPVLASGTVYTKDNAADRASALEQQARAAADTADASRVQAIEVPGATRPLFTSSSKLLTCVARLTSSGPAVLPLAIDFVRFSDADRGLKRSPAVAILLPRQVGAHDGVFLVGPDCATAPDENIYVFSAVLPPG